MDPEQACGEIAMSAQNIARLGARIDDHAGQHWPTGWSRYSKDVTTPKFPPPPRKAQKRSGCSVALAVMTSPSAVTTSADTRLSQAEAVAPHQPADAPTQRQPGNAGVVDRPTRGGQAVHLGFTIKLPPQHAPLGMDATPGRIDANAFHRAQIQHQPAVTGGMAGGVMAPTADGHGQIMGAGECDRLHRHRRPLCNGQSGRVAC